MSDMKLQVKKLPHFKNLHLPAYKTEKSSGLDLCAAVEEPVTLNPGKRTRLPTGLQIAIPDGYEGQIRPRSGLALNHGITMLNTPGTIDADYRGEIKLIAINHGTDPFTIEHGDRIAQLVITPVVRLPLVEVTTLPTTKRGSGGFGSTGMK